MSSKNSNSNGQSGFRTVVLTPRPNSNYPEWSKYIENKATQEHGEAGKCVKSGEFKKFKKPAIPTEVNDFTKMEYALKLKMYRSERDHYQDKRVKLFGMILESLSTQSRNTVESHKDFKAAYDESQVVNLMTIIRTTHEPYSGLELQARLASYQQELNRLKQGKDEPTTLYCQRWKLKVDQAVLAGLEMTNQSYWVHTFLQSLNGSLKDFVDSKLNPARARPGDVPDTLAAAIVLVETHDSYCMLSRPRGTTSQHVVAATTASTKNAGPHRRDKAKRKGGKASGTSNSGSGGSSARVAATVARPACPWCKRNNPSHAADDCFSKPGNEQKKEEYLKRRKPNTKNKQFRSMLINVLGELLMKEQP